PWSGGDPGDDQSLPVRILTQFIVKRCKNLGENDRLTIQRYAPSLENLLPTFDYLRDSVTNELKPVGTMHAQNNWLPNSDFTPPFYGVTVGTVYGGTHNTVSAMKVTRPSPRNIDRDNWLDGEPTEKEFTPEGDGTVLESSAIVEGADNKYTTETHLGLIASDQGIATIFDLLNIDPPAAEPRADYQDAKSSLVIVGNPANFWITDPSGITEKDTDGMVAIMDPKPGKYKLRLLPKSGKTLVIVGQFLENGENLWKEYTLTNFLPKFKTIEFDPINPKEDALR
ncbi:MAG: hypothetical protein Q7S76_02625, partial [bacterium]|nr:hypothetical protein [bacterium]